MNQVCREDFISSNTKCSSNERTKYIQESANRGLSDKKSEADWRTTLERARIAGKSAPPKQAKQPFETEITSVGLLASCRK